MEAESGCLKEKEDLCGRVLGQGKGGVWPVRGAERMPWRLGPRRDCRLGWGKQNFSIEAGAFYRFLETERADSERGLRSQTLSNGVLALPPTDCVNLGKLLYHSACQFPDL